VTSEELKQLEELASKATKGPWTLDDPEDDGQIEVFSHAHLSLVANLVLGKRDAEFIAAARTAVPKLIERVRELETKHIACPACGTDWYLESPVKYSTMLLDRIAELKKALEEIEAISRGRS
jgi:hypothetical protein